MKITIVGAGNMGLAILSYLLANTNHHVTLYTGKNITKNGSLILHEVEEKKITKIAMVNCTNSAVDAFHNADIVFCTYPAFLRRKFIERVENIIPKGSMLGFVPGYGGVEFCCRNLLNRGVTIFGLQRVPYVARAYETGKGIEARILSKKKTLFTAAIPYSKTHSVAILLEDLFDIPCIELREYLSITLVPSNPLLHITGLYNVFKDYKRGISYPKQLKFYEEWNDFTSELLFQYDRELQNICENLNPMDLSEVVSLPVYYESPTPKDMTRKLKSIESFKEVLVPLKEETEGYVPDFDSRMFVEDFPYGVCVIKDFARIAGVKTPTVDMLLTFYEEKTGHKYYYDNGSYTEEIDNTGVPGLFGLNTVKEIMEFYH